MLWRGINLEPVTWIRLLITICCGWQVVISPVGQGFWYLSVGHLLINFVVPLNSVSKSTKLPLA